MNNYLNLVIEQRVSILDKITLYEPFEISILDKLINSTLPKQTFNNKIMNGMYDNEKQQLERYRDLVIDGKAVVKYSRSEDILYGRCNPVKGLGGYNIRRELRHTLFAENFVDVDIDNCHPVMLEQVMTYNGILCPMLQSYVQNRNAWFDIVIKFYKIDELESVKAEPHLLKDIPKNLFIRILFHGGVKNWRETHKILVDGVPDAISSFVKEIDGLCEIIADANPNIAKNISSKKERKNLNGSVCSYLLQEKEVIILEQIFLYCVKNGYIKNNECVLCADGIMLSKKLYKVELLKELEDTIFTTTAFKVKMSNKAMELGYNAILDKSLKYNLHGRSFTSGLLADLFKTIYSNLFVVVNNELYKFNGVYWVKDNCKKNSSLHSFVDTVFYKYLIGYISKDMADHNVKMNALTGDELERAKKELEPMISFLNNVNIHLRSVKKRKDIVEDILIKLTCNTIEFDENPYLLAFTNKIYDLKIGKFIEPCFNQYITVTTGWDWCPYYDDEKEKDFILLLNSIFPDVEVREYYLEMLSTGLFGQQVEKLFIATGGGGNGKGLLNSLMMSALGEYAYKLPSSVLLQPIKEGANPAVANMHKKRFCLAAEPDDKQRICASTLKEITGDTTINCRGLYSSDTNTQLRLTFCLECNGIPKLDEVNDAIQRRIEVIPFISKFVVNNVFDSYTEQDRVANNIHLIDVYYKTDEFRLGYRQALMKLLMNKFIGYRQRGYKFSKLPNSCKEKAHSYLANSDDIYSWFMESYEKVDDDHSFIYIDDIYEQFTRSTYYINMNKKDKREMNKGNFSVKFGSSLYLKPFVRERDSRYANIRHKKQFITKFRSISNDDDVGSQFVNRISDVEKKEMSIKPEFNVVNKDVSIICNSLSLTDAKYQNEINEARERTKNKKW